MTIRTELRAGGTSIQHNEALQVRSTLKAGGNTYQHNETLRRNADRRMIGMRKQVKTSNDKAERLNLMVVRTGLLAGRAGRRGRL